MIADKETDYLQTYKNSTDDLVLSSTVRYRNSDDFSTAAIHIVPLIGLT